MDRQPTFLQARGLLIAAALVVCASGWIQFVRDRRADRPATAFDEHHGAIEGS